MTMKIKSIIIDDEPMARKLLDGMLKEYCPNVEVLAHCENLPEGVKAIKKHQPELVFLDIEMPGYSGLEILDFFNEDEVKFSIIFTTAYNQFAIKAFKLSAVDYLLKPIETEELEAAVNRFEKNSKAFQYGQLKEMVNEKKLQKIAIQSHQSIKFVALSDILFLKAEGAYTYFFVKNEEPILASKNLKNYEEILTKENGFLRCHKSYIININQVTDIHKNDGNFVMIDNTHKLPISNEKTSELMKLVS